MSDERKTQRKFRPNAWPRHRQHCEREWESRRWMLSREAPQHVATSRQKKSLKFSREDPQPHSGEDLTGVHFWRLTATKKRGRPRSHHVIMERGAQPALSVSSLAQVSKWGWVLFKGGGGESQFSVPSLEQETKLPPLPWTVSRHARNSCVSLL